MSGFVRAKRVTDPLDDKAKARLVGTQLSYVSSGSEHSADDDDDLPCLSELVHGFLENDDSDLAHESVNGHESDSDRVDSVADCTDFVEDILRSGSKDSYRNLLSAHVSKAMEAFSCLRNQRPVLRRKVMSFLRELGHNAAICKTKWESSGGGSLTAVKSSTLQNRYVVDLDFASQFEIARPTSQFLKLLHSLPRVFVGRSEDLKTIVRSISDAAKKSLKSRELSLPPWRKNRYMQNKWFGPYRRTVNPSPETTPSVDVVQCRCVGFDAAVNGRLVRTR
ncbi:Sulfate/thiosulfate import ATP-binding protein [Salix suchowensis]|nr:Sulfate/thiosulfate import ATP-binding protein [Salix suchowensis]